MSARLCDLMRQGFMKPLKVKRAKKPLEVVACERCQNWHFKGKHTASKAVKKGEV